MTYYGHYQAFYKHNLTPYHQSLINILTNDDTVEVHYKSILLGSECDTKIVNAIVKNFIDYCINNSYPFPDSDILIRDTDECGFFKIIKTTHVAFDNWKKIETFK